MNATKLIMFLTLFCHVTFAAWTESSEEKYEKNYPVHYEYCATTQIKYSMKYNDGSVGGSGGHGYVYIHGLCKDYSKNYPQVLPCSDIDWTKYKPEFKHEGVGIGLDGNFSNVVWVAIPGRSLLHYGDSHAKAEITKKNISDVIDRAVKLKIFENVELTKVSTLKGLTTNFQTIDSGFSQENVAEFSIGTNLAVNWGRDLRCIKIPFDKSRLSKIANFLNARNNEHFQNANNPFVWSMLYNNCTHLSKQISYLAGLSENTQVNLPLIRQVYSNIAIPLNFLWELINRNMLPTQSPRLRNNGVKLVKIPVSTAKNEMFITKDLKVFKSLTLIQSYFLKQLYQTPRYTVY